MSCLGKRKYKKPNPKHGVLSVEGGASMSDQRTEVECEAFRVPKIVPCWGSDLVALVVDLVEVLFHWLCLNLHLCIYLGWGLLQYTCGGQRAALSAPPSSTKLPGIEMRSLGPWKAGPLSTEPSQQSFNLHYYCFCFWDKISYNQAVFELAESDLGLQMKNFWSSCLCCGVRCDTHLICGCWKLNPGCRACQASISQLSHSLSSLY